MKTLSHEVPPFFPNGPESRAPRPDTYLIKFLVPLALAAALFGSTLWYLLTAPSGSVPTEPQPRLELSLSGAYTSTLSLADHELTVTQCGPSSFSVASTGSAVTPLTLTFAGSPDEASQRSTFSWFGSTYDLNLTLAGTPYTLQSGNVTVSSGTRTFYASFTDAQGQPLELSGRLVCP